MSDNPAVARLFERHGTRYRWFATVTVMLGTLSVVLASTIINVAVPSIMAQYRLEQDQVHWLATGFLAAMTVGMLLNAWAVARFGSRGAYLIALGVFIAASLLGGFADSFVVLVLARVLQGVMAGLIQPLAMITIFQVFPLHKRGQAMGIYGMGVILGPAIAPALGGVLVDAWSWRATFFVVLPACAVAMLLARAFLPDHREERAPPLDWAGLGLLSLGLTATLWALASGLRRGWLEPWLLAALIGGPLLLVAFVLWQRRARHPLFDLRVFQTPGFGGGFLLSMAIGAGVFASTYMFPLYFQQVSGFSASAAGLMLMPAGLSMAFIFPFVGYLTDRMPITGLVAAGLLFFIASMVMMRAADGATAGAWLITWAVLARLAMGLMMPPVTTGSLAMLPPALIPQGAGIINFGRQTGGALGVNLCAVCVQFFSDRYWQAYPEAGHPHAFEVGFDDAYLMLLIVFVLGFWPLRALRRGEQRMHAEKS
ncbi:EmrB/QacA family drug resistance transporter [Alcanivorax sp. 521-1]|uniref:EmrB/QacA family drug resistance transporter n=1 Tax=Alloalcanivorax profundimaris TaxID=2735259 RepID=A0ABS0AV27_9GAMM|nr:DHA2 family efflux MFS transporter permease subunit [Alloalcanivorax profundimaris]MBF5057992.1 EmrB/QacA family drug resistance transporter [Alloalcanivorax profundimaris]